jgi:hypothetical protein
MRCYLEVDQLASAVADEEEDVEGLEGPGLDDEEVGRPDRLSVVGEEGPPALARGTGMVSPTIASDGSGADDDAELEELAANALGAPERVRLAMVAISSRISGLRRGRPRCVPERQRQYMRQPRRCQRRTVSGQIRSRCCLQAG